MPIAMPQHPWVVRNTAAMKGRNIVISPETTDFKFISAGRIILDHEVPTITAQNPGRETTLLVLHGEGTVTVGDQTFAVARFDGVYVPRGAAFTVATDSAIDIMEGSAPTELEYPAQFVKHQEARQQEGMYLKVGAEPFYREIHKVIAENVQGAKLLTGVTMSNPGNWTSWPPHEHAATQEELYLFFDMPRPGFGTQYIYTSLAEPEVITPVYEDDAVVIVKGYHPNVAAPGFPINFAWLLCSLQDHTWRKVGGVNVQPEFLMETGLK
ncbi:MAG: 5-deoxy-glucuronate isomerase [Candidatus Kapabacteria bacterium]|nr:MAG: 5-deoxy-glucuronate isomerase [Chlorobi bacterium OLB7]MBX7216436.1 5-deoxy-glucuronate isomerase [Candidatus Kapabacteria bacterium]